MLRFKHLVFFGPTGQAKWKGQIYGGPRFNWLLNPPVIYHGVFGEGFFSLVHYHRIHGDLLRFQFQPQALH